MRDIFFYNTELQLLHQLPHAISVNLTRKYCGFGTAEIHLPIKNSEVIELLYANPKLIVVTEDGAAVVTGWTLGEDIAIFGRTPEWLLTKRMLLPFSMEGTAQAVATYAAETGASDFLECQDKTGGGKESNFSTDTVRTVYDVVCDALSSENLGFSVVPDPKTKTFRFSIYSGAERNIMVSPSWRTACNMTYSSDSQTSANGCLWYKREIVNSGDWDASKNSPYLSDKASSNAFTYYKITTSDIRFGMKCVEGQFLYCDSSDGEWKVTEIRPDKGWDAVGDRETAGFGRWDAVVDEVKTPADAEKALKAMIPRCETETALRNLKYGEDYSLGDTVRVQTEFGSFRTVEKQRIVSVSIFHDVDSSGIVPVLQVCTEDK